MNEVLTFRRLVPKGGSLVEEIGHSAPKAEIFGASLCSMNFQYPKFWERKVQRPVAFLRRPVRICILA